MLWIFSIHCIPLAELFKSLLHYHGQGISPRESEIQVCANQFHHRLVQKSLNENSFKERYFSGAQTGKFITSPSSRKATPTYMSQYRVICNVSSYVNQKEIKSSGHKNSTNYSKTFIALCLAGTWVVHSRKYLGYSGKLPCLYVKDFNPQMSISEY